VARREVALRGIGEIAILDVRAFLEIWRSDSQLPLPVAAYRIRPTVGVGVIIIEPYLRK
jgi:hypothetical protein